MKQDPDPIDPNYSPKLRYAVDGVPFPFPEEAIPKLFVAYVAAQRALYYAGVDAARKSDGNQSFREFFADVFHEEVRHAIRDRSEIADWMGNNMDPHLEPVDGIGISIESGAGSLTTNETT